MFTNISDATWDSDKESSCLRSLNNFPILHVCADLRLVWLTISLTCISSNLTITNEPMSIHTNDKMSFIKSTNLELGSKLNN